MPWLLLFYTIFTTIQAIFKSIFYALENKYKKQINNKFMAKLQRYNVNKINAIAAAIRIIQYAFSDWNMRMNIVWKAVRFKFKTECRQQQQCTEPNEIGMGNKEMENFCARPIKYAILFCAHNQNHLCSNLLWIVFVLACSLPLHLSFVSVYWVVVFFVFNCCYSWIFYNVTLLNLLFLLMLFDVQ